MTNGSKLVIIDSVWGHMGEFYFYIYRDGVLIKSSIT